jgi:DNA-binding transcriptional regulator YiaG
MGHPARGKTTLGGAKASSRRSRKSAQGSSRGREAKQVEAHDAASALVRLRKSYGLSAAQFSRLLGFTERSVTSWQSGAQEPSAAAQRSIRLLERTYDTLARVMKPESIADWLLTPNRAFGGLKPIEVVERGEIDRLWEMVFRIESGMPI